MNPVDKVLEVSGFDKLNPVQDAALGAGLLDGGNLIIAAPTASGKTGVAEIAALDTIRKGMKVLYIVPLRALASEKHEEFKGKYGPMGVKVAMSIGDYDRSDPWLAHSDLVIVTSEKLDSLLRHGIPWIDSVGLVVADEIHLLDSPDRGPTLEVVLTRLMKAVTVPPRVLGLSATISNHEELAEWLKAKSVKSDYRPVKLYTGVFFNGEASFSPERKLKLNPEAEPLSNLVKGTLAKGKQVLAFISTRKGAESAAEKLGAAVKGKLSAEEAKELTALAGRVERALERPTEQCRRLARCLSTGTAFHHAGLTNKQRGLVEKAFREGLIKTVCATPTLAAGINMPAYRVIIRDLKRFSSFRGMDYIPILEIQQMCGRAGRPAYDKEGEAIMLARSKGEAKHAWENYVLGEPERIHSKLGVEPVLRTHVLALIASGVTPAKKDLFEFFSHTFYAFQYKDLSRLNAGLEKVLDMLRNFKFIEGAGSAERGEFVSGAEIENLGEELKPTRIGRRVAELYIDPITANHLIESMKKGRPTHFEALHMISECMEMKPLPSLRKGDMERLNEFMIEQEENLRRRIPSPWDIEHDEFLRSLKAALMFYGWTEELGEDSLLKDFGVTPGELRARLERADWLLYSAQELGLLLGLRDVLKDLRKSKLRVKFGVREELLPLVRLKGIGRMKARKLLRNGVRGLSELRKIPLKSLAGIVGEKTANSIKEQLGE